MVNYCNQNERNASKQCYEAQDDPWAKPSDRSAPHIRVPANTFGHLLDELRTSAWHASIGVASGMQILPSTRPALERTEDQGHVLDHGTAGQRHFCGLAYRRRTVREQASSMRGSANVMSKYFPARGGGELAQVPDDHSDMGASGNRSQ